MKICIINSLYPPYNRGGAEVVAEKQAQELADQGHDVFVITSRPFTRFFNTNLNINKEKKVKIYRFYPWNIFSLYYIDKHCYCRRLIWRIIDVFNILSAAIVRDILIKEKPDVVYTHNLTGMGYLIPRSIKKLGIKHVHRMHDVALIYPSGLLIKDGEKSFENWFFPRTIYEKTCRRLFDSPDEVKFPSEWLKELYESRGFFKKSKRAVKRNFEVTTEDLLKGKKAKDPHRTKFIFIGQVEYHKGVLFLIKAMCQLPADSYSLLIVGNGSKLEEARILAGNNPRIKFESWQSMNRAGELMEKADYTIVPSLCYENAPVTIGESLECKIPVIASELGGIPELINDGVNGYLFKAGDEEDFLKVVKRLTK